MLPDIVEGAECQKAMGRKKNRTTLVQLSIISQQFSQIGMDVVGPLLLRVAVHRKYGRPRSRPHLIDHIFGARITLILLFARLFY